MRETMTETHILNEVLDLLFDAKITRTESEVDYAIQVAAENWSTNATGWFVPPTAIRVHEPDWHEFLHGKHGVYDLLEIDSEDGIYDRLDNNKEESK